MTATRPTADDRTAEELVAAYLNVWPLLTTDEARAELGLDADEEDR